MLQARLKKNPLHPHTGSHPRSDPPTIHSLHPNAPPTSTDVCTARRPRQPMEWPWRSRVSRGGALRTSAWGGNEGENVPRASCLASVDVRRRVVGTLQQKCRRQPRSYARDTGWRAARLQSTAPRDRGGRAMRCELVDARRLVWCQPVLYTVGEGGCRITVPGRAKEQRPRTGKNGFRIARRRREAGTVSSNAKRRRRAEWKIHTRRMEGAPVRVRRFATPRRGHACVRWTGGVRERDRDGALRSGVLSMQLQLHAYRKTRGVRFAAHERLRLPRWKTGQLHEIRPPLKRWVDGVGERRSTRTPAAQGIPHASNKPHPAVVHFLELARSGVLHRGLSKTPETRVRGRARLVAGLETTGLKSDTAAREAKERMAASPETMARTAVGLPCRGAQLRAQGERRDPPLARARRSADMVVRGAETRARSPRSPGSGAVRTSARDTEKKIFQENNSKPQRHCRAGSVPPEKSELPPAILSQHHRSRTRASQLRAPLVAQSVRWNGALAVTRWWTIQRRVHEKSQRHSRAVPVPPQESELPPDLLHTPGRQGVFQQNLPSRSVPCSLPTGVLTGVAVAVVMAPGRHCARRCFSPRDRSAARTEAERDACSNRSLCWGKTSLVVAHLALVAVCYTEDEATRAVVGLTSRLRAQTGSTAPAEARVDSSSAASARCERGAGARASGELASHRRVRGYRRKARATPSTAALLGSDVPRTRACGVESGVDVGESRRRRSRSMRTSEAQSAETRVGSTPWQSSREKGARPWRGASLRNAGSRVCACRPRKAKGVPRGGRVRTGSGEARAHLNECGASEQSTAAGATSSWACGRAHGHGIGWLGQPTVAPRGLDAGMMPPSAKRRRCAGWKSPPHTASGSTPVRVRRFAAQQRGHGARAVGRDGSGAPPWEDGIATVVRRRRRVRSGPARTPAAQGVSGRAAAAGRGEGVRSRRRGRCTSYPSSEGASRASTPRVGRVQHEHRHWRASRARDIEAQVSSWGWPNSGESGRGRPVTDVGSPRVRGRVDGVGGPLRTHSGSARHPGAQANQKGRGARVVQLAPTAQTARRTARRCVRRMRIRSNPLEVKRATACLVSTGVVREGRRRAMWRARPYERGEAMARGSESVAPFPCSPADPGTLAALRGRGIHESGESGAEGQRSSLSWGFRLRGSRVPAKEKMGGGEEDVQITAMDAVVWTWWWWKKSSQAPHASRACRWASLVPATRQAQPSSEEESSVCMESTGRGARVVRGGGSACAASIRGGEMTAPAAPRPGRTGTGPLSLTAPSDLASEGMRGRGREPGCVSAGAGRRVSCMPNGIENGVLRTAGSAGRSPLYCSRTPAVGWALFAEEREGSESGDVATSHVTNEALHAPGSAGQSRLSGCVPATFQRSSGRLPLELVIDVDPRG
ncbi:hypothetical protein DFH08DRAFT_1035882 [Mycena albidolilacea]|uniref:Uncharacterized protein n=1 Tax=Mycena albidolilacea TaxID=1033008 RepID=A0AAD6ZEY2_9AGAR|nr:hypothetical protein DFH08DRAFT_1035882 [Mycena albidolilacea]